MPVDPIHPDTRRTRQAVRAQRLALCLGAALCLSACATPPAPAPATVSATPPEPAVEPPKPLAAEAVRPPEPAPPPRVDADSVHAVHAPTAGLLSVLLFADRLRGLSSTELLLELNALGDPGAAPALQLQTALVLMHLHQPAATARALGLLQRVVAHPAPESAPFKPLARLLATGLSDQKRLEDTLDRQAQQLRDQQRRIDVLSDRLDAMRDIERSLTPRGPGRGPAP